MLPHKAHRLREFRLCSQPLTSQPSLPRNSTDGTRHSQRSCRTGLQHCRRGWNWRMLAVKLKYSRCSAALSPTTWKRHAPNMRCSLRSSPRSRTQAIALSRELASTRKALHMAAKGLSGQMQKSPVLVREPLLQRDVRRQRSKLARKAL